MIRTMCTSSLLGGTGQARRFAYDADEPLHVEAGAADERAVHLGLGHERLGVLGLHASPVQDTDRLGDLFRRELGEEPAQIPLHLGGLAGRRVDPRADRPHRLVGEHGLGDLVGRQSGEARAELALDGREGQPLPALLGGLADAEYRGEVVRKDRAYLQLDLLVRLAHLLAPLGMTGEDPLAPKLGEHGHGDLAGVRASRLRMTVLSAELDRRAGENFGHRRERGERRAHGDLHAARALEALPHPGRERPGFRDGAVHLPVADDERCSHRTPWLRASAGGAPAPRPPAARTAYVASVSASTPGSLRPSRNSRNAPPAVEIYPILSVTPAWVTAATVSPPPITVNADAPATTRASASVPAAKAGRSKTPIGPFHTMVRAPLSAAVKRSTVRGPMSRPIWSAGISRIPTVRPRGLSRPSATTASSGSTSATPRRRAASSVRRAVSTWSRSTSERPMAWPRA